MAVDVRVACVLLAAAVLAPTTSASAQSRPELRLTAPAAPGGGWDQTARALQLALQAEGLAGTVTVENVVGAAGTIGLARFTGAERGRGDALMVSGLIMLGGVVMHQSPITLRDVTPIARLTGEYEVIVVPVGSPFRTLADLVRALRDKPEAVSWGGGSAGGSDQMLAGLLAEAVGVAPRRINYIAFSGGGESLAAIVGGQVSVGVNGLAELEPQIQAGTVRALAISSATRLPGLDVPTLREQGIALDFENWRSVVAPPGLPDADRARLQALVAAVVRSKTWTDLRIRYRWLDRYLDGDAFRRFGDAEEARVRGVLSQLGVGAVSPSAGPSSAGVYPWFVLAALVGTGLWAGVTRPKAQGPRPKSQPGRQSPFADATAGPTTWRPLAWIVAGLAGNLLTAEPLGFVLSSALLYWTTARAFDPSHPWRDAVCGFAVAALAYGLFDRVLGVSLPAGVWGGRS
ncbi:MAG TPA: tripartite tricarboxylate transporter substrate-binding protein [Vicinamibacterales bacterium]